VIYSYLRRKAVGLGATLHALNGTEDHVAYVNKQKEHHAHGTAIAVLERTETDLKQQA